ncbi:cytochrome c peroxidase [Arcicella aurantiaca]|uniref:Cytochrome c peroxidase n=1 Tax=Arcicella aurantiaca TaxID=591202 RepID=A0A316DB83_9BACT|nr:cytochrome c peroxidase [Arcicella aurantiaca]PWK15461.1 cytochrome c peroxidase [Arcicella aurantiaca]
MGQFGATNVNVNTQSSWTKGTPKKNNFLGFEGIETQAIAGQDVHRLQVGKIFLDEIPQYREMFKKAFPTMNVNDNYQLKINAGLAIAAYERTLLATEAPFQQWLKGNSSAMTDAQKQGAILFFSKAECFLCHNSPSLSSMKFYAIGMADLKNGFYGNNKVVATPPTKAEHKGRGDLLVKLKICINSKYLNFTT